MGATVGATAPGGRSRPITALGLKALTVSDAGRTINFGESMAGKVHVGRDGAVSVHVTWRYRIGGKTREVRIGTWREIGGMSLKALRDERDKLATELRSGVDPIERRTAEKLEADAKRVEAVAELRNRLDAAKAAELEQQRRLTVRDLFERWATTQLQPHIRADGKRTGRKDGGKYVRDQFERHVFPRIGNMIATDVRKADLLAVLDAQTSAGKMRTANVLLADLKQLFDFATDREITASNPLATTKKSRIGGASVERDRVLSDEEVTLLCRAVPLARMQPRSAVAIWLLLATGARVGELMGASWAEDLPEAGRDRQSRIQAMQAIADAADVKLGIVDLAAGTWYLPDTKNQRDHTIHLSNFAMEQFRALAALREKLKGSQDGSLSPWVFPATDSRRPVIVNSFGKQLSDRQREPGRRLSGRTKATTALMMPGGRWTAHDLRRTASTIMARCGFSSDVINECLNHIQADRMSRVYIQDRRAQDQVRAFDALGGRLEALTREHPVASNIIDLVAA